MLILLCLPHSEVRPLHLILTQMQVRTGHWNGHRSTSRHTQHSMSRCHYYRIVCISFSKMRGRWKKIPCGLLRYMPNPKIAMQDTIGRHCLNSGMSTICNRKSCPKAIHLWLFQSRVVVKVRRLKTTRLPKTNALLQHPTSDWHSWLLYCHFSSFLLFLVYILLNSNYLYLL